MFRWIFKRSEPQRYGGKTANEWCGEYAFRLRLEACEDMDQFEPAVVAALSEAVSARSKTSQALDTRSIKEWWQILLFSDHCECVRVLCALSIGLSKCISMDMTLIAALNDPVETVRRAAASALYDLGTVRGLAAVVAGNRHGQGIRMRAARRLCTLGTDAADAIPSLFELLHDHKTNYRSHWAAEDALAAIGQPAIPFLIHGLIHGTSVLKLQAAIALRTMNQAPEYDDLIDKILVENDFGDPFSRDGSSSLLNESIEP